MKDIATGQQSAGDMDEHRNFLWSRECTPRRDEVLKLEWSHLCGVRSDPPALSSLASPGQRLREATLGWAQGKSEGPPSSDKGNLERKGKIVKRGAKGHKGKKKPTPPLNKTEDQDCC